MNPTQAVNLVKMVRGGCPGMELVEGMSEIWYAVLGDLRIEDCSQAVVNLVGASRRFIAPADIREEVRRIRDKRLEGVDRIQPPDGLTPLAYRDWLRDTRAAVADGTLAVPAEITGQPIQLKALGGAA